MGETTTTATATAKNPTMMLLVGLVIGLGLMFVYSLFQFQVAPAQLESGQQVFSRSVKLDQLVLTDGHGHEVYLQCGNENGALLVKYPQTTFFNDQRGDVKITSGALPGVFVRSEGSNDVAIYSSPGRGPVIGLYGRNSGRSFLSAAFSASSRDGGVLQLSNANPRTTSDVLLLTQRDFLNRPGVRPRKIGDVGAGDPTGASPIGAEGVGAAPPGK